MLITVIHCESSNVLGHGVTLLATCIPVDDSPATAVVKVVVVDVRKEVIDVRIEAVLGVIPELVVVVETAKIISEQLESFNYVENGEIEYCNLKINKLIQTLTT